MVHRAIKQSLTSDPATAYSAQAVAAMGEHCSSLERRADEAARDATDSLKCEFMQDKVGETFQGVITGVHNFGLFVEIETYHISGLVHITALEKEYFHYDPVRQQLNGERSGKQYSLGDAMQVQLAAVDPAERRIDFVLTTAPADPIKKPKKKRRVRKHAKH